MRRLALIGLLLAAAPSAALELAETGSYDLDRPASLDYDPTFCGLWIANEGPEVVLKTLDGLELRRLRSGLRRIKAVALEGDALIVADGTGAVQRLSKDGAPLGTPFALEGGWADTEGIAVDGEGNLVTVEDDPERLSWFAPDGTLLRRIDTTTLAPPLMEPQGIAIDPRTGHLLVVDDREGTNALYELSPEGAVLARAPLWEHGTDPEGVAIRPGSGQLFVAFDGGARVTTFDHVPTLPADAAPLPPGADCMMF